MSTVQVYAGLCAGRNLPNHIPHAPPHRDGSTCRRCLTTHWTTPRVGGSRRMVAGGPPRCDVMCLRGAGEKAGGERRAGTGGGRARRGRLPCAHAQLVAGAREGAAVTRTRGLSGMWRLGGLFTEGYEGHVATCVCPLPPHRTTTADAATHTYTQASPATSAPRALWRW